MSCPKKLPELKARDIKRFYSYVDRSGDCHLWTRARGRGGYGLFKVSKRMLKAHRVSFFLSNPEADQALIVRHRCDNPPCVRIDHLQLGTSADNSHDRDVRGRANTPYGWRTVQRKLSTYSVLAIRALIRVGYSDRELAGMFRVARESIRDVRTGRSYAWLDDNGIDKHTGRNAI